MLLLLEPARRWFSFWSLCPLWLNVRRKNGQNDCSVQRLPWGAAGEFLLNLLFDPVAQQQSAEESGGSKFRSMVRFHRCSDPGFVGGDQLSSSPRHERVMTHAIGPDTNVVWKHGLQGLFSSGRYGLVDYAIRGACRYRWMIPPITLAPRPLPSRPAQFSPRWRRWGSVCLVRSD
jgi:hypothetical protein